MTRFAGNHAVRVGERGEIALPPPWWLAALAADPAGDPGPTLFVVAENAMQGRFKVITPEEHLRLFATMQTRDAGDSPRIDAFPLCLTDRGALPGSDTFDRVPAFAPGRMVTLSGLKDGFALAPPDPDDLAP